MLTETNRSPEPPIPPLYPDETRALFTRILANLETVIQGKSEQLRLVLCCCAAGGHVLLDDVPGTGKTTLAKALALSMGCGFKRIQFTPDLLPTDIVGTSIYDQRDCTFHFRPGPVFTNVLIADEINRASPRTQSALLEALAERQVSVEGETRLLEEPFLCIATQNPLEFHGTYPLPEASLDRFSIQTTLGYPSAEEEIGIHEALKGRHPVDTLSAVATRDEILALQAAVQNVTMEASVTDYLVRVVRATREHPDLRLGVSLRGSLIFGRMARARALALGRSFVLPDDLKALAVPVLAHRLVLDSRARYAGADRAAIVREVLGRTTAPR